MGNCIWRRDGRLEGEVAGSREAGQAAASWEGVKGGRDLGLVVSRRDARQHLVVWWRYGSIN